jgi:hypothetical protein
MDIPIAAGGKYQHYKKTGGRTYDYIDAPTIAVWFHSSVVRRSTGRLFLNFFLNFLYF